MWLPWKLLVTNLGVGCVLLACSTLAQFLLPWFGIIATPGVCACVAIVACAGMLSYAYLRWPEVIDWEEEIVAEHTIHQELWLFRLSWVAGWLLLAAASVYFRFTWIFQLGAGVGGILLWLYLFDIGLEICRNWDEVWEIITSEPEHAIKMLASGLSVVLFAAFLSWCQFGGITQTERQSTAPQDSYWQKTKEYAKKGWDYLQKQWQSVPPAKKSE